MRVQKIIEFIFPTRCLFCKQTGKIICENCFLKIEKSVRCENNILSVYSFKNPYIDKLLWRLKYHHTGDVAGVFGKVLAEEMENRVEKKLDEKWLRHFSSASQNSKTIYLIPISLNQGDKRMHNHAELISNSIKNNFAGKYKIEILTSILIKNSHTKQAHTKSRRERFQNIQNSFSINSKFNLKFLPDSIFIIVDDVTTTGFTINSARKVLSLYLKIKEDEILAVTVAH